MHYVLMYALRIRVKMDNPNKGFMCVSVQSFETERFPCSHVADSSHCQPPCDKKKKKKRKKTAVLKTSKNMNVLL